MKAEIVQAEKIMKSPGKRLDADFHLNGRKLKAVCTRRSYCVEVTVDEMQEILRRDKFEINTGRKPLHQLLNEATAAFDIEYDGHFGPNVFFTLNAGDDKPNKPAVDAGKPTQRQRIINIIRDYINRKP
jgi:hypothetical protein